MDNSLLWHFWMRKFPFSIREVLVSLKEDALMAKLTESVDRMFDANPKRKIAVTVPFTTPLDSILQYWAQVNHLISQINVVLKTHTKNVRFRTLDHLDILLFNLINPFVCIIRI